MASILGAALPAGWASGCRPSRSSSSSTTSTPSARPRASAIRGGENSVVQWGEKSSYAWEAVKSAAMLREEAFGLRAGIPAAVRRARPSPCSTRSAGRAPGLVQVFIDHEMLPRDRPFRILDAVDSTRGRRPAAPQPQRRVVLGPLGARRAAARVQDADDQSGIRPRPRRPRPPRRHSKISTTRSRSIARPGPSPTLVTRNPATTWSTRSGEWRLGQLIYEKGVDRGDFEKDVFPKDHPFTRTTLRDVKVGEVVPGPIWDSVELRGELDGCTQARGRNRAGAPLSPGEAGRAAVLREKRHGASPRRRSMSPSRSRPRTAKCVYEAQGRNCRSRLGPDPRVVVGLADGPELPGRPRRRRPDPAAQQPGAAGATRRPEPRQMAARYRGREAARLIRG